jgi:hypothetical protein
MGRPRGRPGFILMLLNSDISAGCSPARPEGRSRRFLVSSGGFGEKMSVSMLSTVAFRY